VASFVRDAGTLLRGGYTLDQVTPVDQFRYSHHVELVGVFSKPFVRKKR
jgi:23S rRNA (uracil1939-C5)-methyltransferase